MYRFNFAKGSLACSFKQLVSDISKMYEIKKVGLNVYYFVGSRIFP